ALDGTDALREVEHLRFAERLCRVPASLLLPDDGRVEALLDRRPDAEGWREDLVPCLVAHDKVRAVPHAELVDLAEEVVDGVAGEDIRETRFDADSDERESARLL